MEDKVIKWLEENVNKKDMYYFKESATDKNIIECYNKESNNFVCVFHREIIEESMHEDAGGNNGIRNS